MKWLMCLLLCMGSVEAAEWGRLFYSQHEREQGVGHHPAAQPAASVKRFDGELQTPRKKVRWVNGQIAEPKTGVKPGDAWREP